VGVLCQRLDFIETHQLRVPRCELLLASQGAKGTIRSGNFSQLSNVIQSGGDDGMWSFDRYQRWMSQHKQWVRPATATAVVDDPPAAVAAPAAPAKPAAKRTPVQAPTDNAEIVIDEELDLSEIAELAKRIEDRTP
jgi:twitching motility protein PilT